MSTPDVHGISFDPKSKVFRLESSRSLYAFRVTARGELEHLYFGAKLSRDDDLSLFALSAKDCATPFDPSGQQVVKDTDPFDLQHLTTDELKAYWEESTKISKVRSQHGEDHVHERRKENAYWREWQKRIGENMRKTPNEPEVVLSSTTRGKETLSSTTTSGAIRQRSLSSAEETLLHGLQKQPLPNQSHSFAAALPSTPPSRSRDLNAIVESPAVKTPVRHGWEPPDFAEVPEATHVVHQIMGKNAMLLEWSDFGSGDFRTPSFRVQYPNLGTDLSPLCYKTHSIVQGKVWMEPKQRVPQVRCENKNDCSTLTITLHDTVTNLQVELYYTVFMELDVFTRRAVVRNKTGQHVQLRNMSAATFDFDAERYWLTHLQGSWAREAQKATSEINQGTLSISSTRGASSHMHNPCFMLSRGAPPAEDGGEHFGFALVYSGSFLIELERTETGRMRANMSMNPLHFQWLLEEDESFESPEVLFAWSGSGVTNLSHKFHNAILERVIPPRFRYERCPILVNTWEAMYFGLAHEKVIRLARAAAAASVEMLVIDDGWFTNRSDDTGGLGDWVLDKAKFPFGLGELCKQVNKLGLKFGIWVEPEMVSPNAELYRRHPDWILHAPGRPRTMRRNQFVLDFGRPEVRSYILDTLAELLGSAAIEYVKWDMNRHVTEAQSGALGADRMCEAAHRHIVGVYEVLGCLTAKFPDVRFETCSGGGGRFDLGMLYFSPQAWASDNTDAFSRCRIQTGFSLLYPPSTMAAHISAMPNHQTMRRLPMKLSAAVAMMGSFGLELDVSQMEMQSVAELKSYVEVYKSLGAILYARGTKYYRLEDPFDMMKHGAHGHGVCAWSFVTADGSDGFVFGTMMQLVEIGKIWPRLRLKGLREDTRYRVAEIVQRRGERDPQTFQVLPVVAESMKELCLSGSALMRAGLPMSFLYEGDSIMLRVRAEGE
jgi:alpha-galactosidase